MGIFKRWAPTPEQLKVKLDAETRGMEARRELAEAKELARVLRDMREKNHFASSFRKALGGNDGS